jgi:hypothetical protein
MGVSERLARRAPLLFLIAAVAAIAQIALQFGSLVATAGPWLVRHGQVIS